MTNDMVEIRSLLEKSLIDSDAKWIAFSGGLDSSIVAKIQSKKNINGVTITVSYTHMKLPTICSV